MDKSNGHKNKIIMREIEEKNKRIYHFIVMYFFHG